MNKPITVIPARVYVAASAGEHGSISPMGEITLEEGESVTFTVTPDQYYKNTSIFVNGEKVTETYSYTWNHEDGDGNINAQFEEWTIFGVSMPWIAQQGFNPAAFMSDTWYVNPTNSSSSQCVFDTLADALEALVLKRTVVEDNFQSIIFAAGTYTQPLHVTLSDLELITDGKVVIDMDSVANDPNQTDWSLVTASSSRYEPVGIFVEDVENVIIDGICVVNAEKTIGENSYGAGIWIAGGGNHVIQNVECSDNYVGLRMDPDRVYTWDAVEESAIESSTFENNGYGLLLNTQTKRCVLYDNTIANNLTGIWLVNDPLENIITGNTISDNKYGLKVSNSSTGNNVVYMNTFTENYEYCCASGCKLSSALC